MNQPNLDENEKQIYLSNINDSENIDYQSNKNNGDTPQALTQSRKNSKKKQHIYSNSFKSQGLYQNIYNKMTSKLNKLQQNIQQEQINDNNMNVCQQNNFQIKYNKRASQEILRDFQNDFNDDQAAYKKYSFTPRQRNCEMFIGDEIGPWEQDEKFSLFPNEKIHTIMPNSQNMKKTYQPNSCIDKDERTKSPMKRSLRLDQFQKASIGDTRKLNDDYISKSQQNIQIKQISQRVISNYQGAQLDTSTRSSKASKIQYEFNPNKKDNIFQQFNSQAQQTGVMDSFLKSIPIKKQGNSNNTKEQTSDNNCLSQSPKLNLYQIHFQQNQFQKNNKHLKGSFANFLKNKIKSKQSSDDGDEIDYEYENIIQSDEQFQTNIQKNHKQKSSNIFNQKLNSNECNNEDNNNQNSFFGDKIILISQYINSNEVNNQIKQNNQQENTKNEKQKNNIYLISAYKQNEINQNSASTQMQNKDNEKDIYSPNYKTQNSEYHNKNSIHISKNNKFKFETEPADMEDDNYQKRKQSKSIEFAHKSIQSNLENKQIFVHYENIATYQNLLQKKVVNIKKSNPYSEQSKRSSFKQHDFAQIFNGNIQKSQTEDQSDHLNNVNNQYQNSNLIGSLMIKNQSCRSSNRNQFQSHLKQRVIKRTNTNNSEGNISLTRQSMSNTFYVNPNNNPEQVMALPQFRSSKSQMGNINLQRHNQQIKENKIKLKQEEDMQKFLKSIEVNTQQMNIQDNSPKIDIIKQTQLKQDLMLDQNFRISGMKSAVQAHHQHHKNTQSCSNNQQNFQINTNYISNNYFNGKDTNIPNYTDSNEKISSTLSNYFPINPLKNKSTSKNKNNIYFSKTPKESAHHASKSQTGFFQFPSSSQKYINQQIITSPQQSVSQQHSPQQPQNKNNIFFDYINLK